MADQGTWFKLWIGADDDPDLGDLPLDDFARWCKFGMYLKKYGSQGTIELKPPCLPLQNKFRVSSFDGVLSVVSRFPNCNVTGVTNATVTWKNWQKYQGDNSVNRVRKFRQNVTLKKRREEKRREERRGEEKENTKAVVFPDWLDRETWQDFLEHRQKIKKPMTPRAKDLAIEKLRQLKDAGHNPNEVMKQSIFNGWQGLFELRKDSGNGAGANSKEPKGFNSVREFIARSKA